MGNTACGAGGGGLSQGGRKGSVAGRSGVERRRGERGEIAPVRRTCSFLRLWHSLSLTRRSFELLMMPCSLLNTREVSELRGSPSLLSGEVASTVAIFAEHFNSICNCKQSSCNNRKAVRGGEGGIWAGKGRSQTGAARTMLSGAISDYGTDPVPVDARLPRRPTGLLCRCGHRTSQKVR